MKGLSFQAFINELADVVAASGADTHEAALAVPHKDATIDDFVKLKVIEMGENLQFRRFVRYAVAGEGVVASYIHLGGKVGVLIEVATSKPETAGNPAFRDFVKDLTLHIAASNPKGLAREDIAADLVEAEKDIFRVQLAETGKPAEMIEKILVGKMSKFFAESCLLEQGFVKDPDTTVKAMLEAKGKTFGDTLSIRRFTRFAVGE
jgi:elongation factor Ts